MRAKMAAGHFSKGKFLIFFTFILSVYASNFYISSFKKVSRRYDRFIGDCWTVTGNLIDLKLFVANHCHRSHNNLVKLHLRRPITVWHKHGHICLLLPPLDITICMDILPNPGPSSLPTKITSILKIGGNFKRPLSSIDLNNYSTRTIVYSKSKLFKLKAKYTISHDLYSILKDQKLLRTRRIPSGLSACNKICSIPVHTSHRVSTNLKKQSGVNQHNLQPLKRVTVNRSKNSSLNLSDVNKTQCGNLNLNVATINCESCNNKAAMIADYILEQDLDICCLTETWLNADDPVTIGELCPNGYKLISIPRKDRRGGGVAVVVKEPLSVRQNCPDDVAFHSFEHLTTIITHPQHSQPFNLCIVYRPLRSDKNTTSISVFFDEISELFTSICIKTGRLLITGDFNIHVDLPEKPDVSQFLQIIESFGLKQHVNVPTHVTGHILDLVFTREDCDFLSCVPKAHFMMTSHSTILFSLNWAKPSRPAIVRTCRKIKAINLKKF